MSGFDKLELDEFNRKMGFEVSNVSDKPRASLFGVLVFLGVIASGVFSIVLGEWRVVVVAVLVWVFLVIGEGVVNQVKNR